MGKPKRVFEAICCEPQNFFARNSELFLPVFTGIFIIVLRILKKGLSAFCVLNLLYLHNKAKFALEGAKGAVPVPRRTRGRRRGITKG